MPKKIFDIFPPRPPKERIRIFREKKPWPFFKRAREIIVASLVILILLSALFYFTLSKAEIEIWPEAEILRFQREIEIDEKITGTDLSLWLKKEVIPGQFLQEEKEISSQFSSSGIIKKETLAKGTIRVYNKYHQSITLIKGTHFMSNLGKQFHSLKKITIPAKGYIDIEVEADTPGEDYNIEPAKFSVPGLRKYSPPELFYSVWGESFSSMKGGFIGKASQVTQKDLDQAENSLVEKLLKEGEESLQQAIPPDYILLPGAIKQEIIEKFSLAQAGQELESFISKVKINSKALIFKKSDLENFTKGFLYSQIGPRKKIDEESLEIKYSSKSINLEAGKITLALEIGAKIYSDINIQDVAQRIRGKSLTEADHFLKKMPGVFEVRVKLWPFWVKKVPENTEKIRIKINID